MRRKFNTLYRIDSDKFINKALNRALAEILGVPGESAGKSEGNIQEQSSAYNAGQMDENKTYTNDKYSVSAARTSNTPTGFTFGQTAALKGIDFAFNQLGADIAWKRQKEFYDNHLSMSAKVQEYQDAGLNPMALGGAGVGATSAPSVQAAEGGAGIGEILGTILNYKVQSKVADAEARYRKTQTVAQEIENRYKEENLKQQLAIQQATYRKLTADATTAEITAVWAPSMLESQYKNSVADEALKKANTALSNERVSEIKQSIAQASERFPQEIANLKQNYAQMAALAYMYQTAAKNNLQENENLKQQFANLEEQNREIKNRADLHQTEIDTFMARNSKVTEGADGMIIVTAPDGTITRFDALGLKRTTRHDMSGKPVKK